MKKLVSIILAVAMLLSMVLTASADNTNPFTDVAADAWYHDEVVKAVQSGIIAGKSATEFKPDDLLTYAEAIKLAACINQVYTLGDVTLTPGEVWYEPYVKYCAENGITTKDYNYSESVTRAGYIEIFANALPDEAYTEINNISYGSILDVKDNAPYAIYVYKFYRAGIVAGVDDARNCAPDANIKRCEVATIISRMLDEEVRVKFDMGEESEKEEIINIGTTIEEEKDDNDDGDNKTEVYVKPDASGKEEEEPINIDPEDPEFTTKVPTQTVTPDIIVLPTVPVDDIDKPVMNADLTIDTHPEGLEADKYGIEHTLEVVVYGGKAPYTYEWYYYTGNKNEKSKVENGDYVKNADTAKLVLSVEKDNELLGKKIYCQITDGEGTTVESEMATVYGPFSMPVESYSILNATKDYVLAGRVEDGVLRKGDKISVIRDGKVIAVGFAKDLQMFNISLDETVKGDNVRIVFDKQDGATPHDGDIVVKSQPLHVVDTSDIIN